MTRGSEVVRHYVRTCIHKKKGGGGGVGGSGWKDDLVMFKKRRIHISIITHPVNKREVSKILHYTFK